MTAPRAAAVFGLLTVVLTWPQAFHLASVPDFKDAYFNVWRMAWVAHQLPRDPAHLFDANIFHPLTNTLAFSDAVLLQGVLGAPLIWAGIPPVVVCNLAVLASFVLCGLGMFLLVRDLTGSPMAAVLGGTVFAFAPFRFDHYYHLELLWAQWMPFALWMLHRTLTSGRLRHGLMTGAFIALQGFSCIYYVVYFATALVVMAPLLVVAHRETVTRRGILALVAGAALAAALLLPYVQPYRAARAMVGDRPAAGLITASAGPKHYLAATPDNVIYGRLTGTIGVPEKRLFVGVTAGLLALAALWPPFRATRLAYAAMLAVAIDGSFGHRGILFPWLRDHAVIFRGLRVPARYGQLVLLATGVLAGYGFARLRTALARRRPRWALPAGCLAAVVLVAEYVVAPMTLTPLPTVAGGVDAWLRQQPPGVVAEFPFPVNTADVPREGQRVYRSTFHWKPLLNGYSGYYPTSYSSLWQPLAAFPSEQAVELLRSRGVSYLVVHERDYGPERYAVVIAELSRRLDVERFGPFDEGGSEVTAWRLMSMRGDGRGRILP